MRKLTEELKAQVRALSGRTQQKHIASELNISVHLVRKTQREFGLLPHSMEPLSAETKGQVLALFRQGHGAPYIAKFLNIPQHRVQDVREEYRFTHAKGIVGHRYHLTVKGKRAMRRALRESERKIAKQFGVSREWLSKFRHSLWKPRKKAQAKHCNGTAATPDHFMQLVTRVCAECLSGKLPVVDDTQFVATMMSAFAHTTLAGQPKPVLDCFAAGLREAVATLRESQNTRWKN